MAQSESMKLQKLLRIITFIIPAIIGLFLVNEYYGRLSAQRVKTRENYTVEGEEF